VARLYVTWHFHYLLFTKWKWVCKSQNAVFLFNKITKATSNESCGNLIFMIHLVCQFQQHIRSAPLNTANGSYLHFVIARWTVLTSTWMQWYHSLMLGNKLFLPCSFIFRWCRSIRWLVTSINRTRSNGQLLSYTRTLPQEASIFSSRKSWTARFKMITSNSQGITTKKNR